MKQIPLLLLLSASLLFGCLPHPLHQGNDIDPFTVQQIHEGDTRFRVEKIMGTPVLTDTFHPHRSIYIEDVDDPETGKKFRRRVVIEYDEMNRVKTIKSAGFDRSVKP